MNTLKSILCFILTVLLSGYSCYGQEQSRYKCSYRFDFLRDTLKGEYFRQEIYIVQIGDNLTKGFTYQKFYLDSLLKASPDLYRKLFSASVEETIGDIRRTGDLSYGMNNFFNAGYFASTLYKDYKKNKIQVRDKISTHSFIYTDELKPQDWEILSDTATILGYHCQKAKCSWRGRDYEAWFTQEIPISEGPWKFYGLPGLITKLYDTKKHYSFELIGFQEIKEPIDIKTPKDAQKIERKEFYRMQFGEKANSIANADMAKVGLYNDKPDKSHIVQYDFIERDYK